MTQTDHAAALQRIHSLKGSAATLGAKNIVLAATDLEDRLLSNQGSPKAFEVFFTALAEAQVNILFYLQAEEHFQRPLAEPSFEDAPKKALPLAPFAILLVEDNALVQTTLQEVLVRAGATVDGAQDGQEALNLLQMRTYDAVLMDMHMPVLDGMQTTQHIRAQKQFVHLPIIGIGAGPVDREKELCLTHGMNDFISKQTKTADMIAVLAYWLGSDKNKPASKSNTN